jgi:hypothetical protein
MRKLVKMLLSPTTETITFMKKQHLLLMALVALCMPVTFNSCNGNGKKDGNHVAAPPHAASAKTWVFGDQTWSDAIQIPECNKESFELSASAPQCRSYSREGKTYYYYNWRYVQAHAEQLCPTPWHVPTNIELDYMCKTAPNVMVELAWGFSGFANEGYLSYWDLFGSVGSVTEKNLTTSHYLNYGNGYMSVNGINKNVGLPVHCVR